MSHSCIQYVQGNRLPVMVLWLVFWLAGPRQMHGAETTSDYSTIRGFFGKPVNSDTMARISAVATYVDLDWKLFYAQDETGGCLVRHPAPNWSFAPGDRILIEGYRMDAATTNPPHVLRDVNVQRLAAGQRPAPRVATGANLDSRAFESHWVRVKGTIRSVVELSRLKLFLEVDGKPVILWVHRYQPTDLAGLLDAEITVDAICCQEGYAATGRAEETYLLTDTFENIRVDRAGPARPFELVRTPIGQLRIQPNTPTTPTRQLIRGRVTAQQQGISLSVRDETDQATVFSPLQVTLAMGDLVEAIGFPSTHEEKPALRDAEFRVVETSAVPPVAAQANTSLRVLRTIKEIVGLSREEAGREYPLQVTGVITHFTPPGKALFLQDGESAIYVSLMSQSPAVKAGQRVEISGVTKPGGVLPMISPVRISVQGDGVLPPAPFMSYHAGMTGLFDCRRVEVQGVVQSTTYADGILNLDLVAVDGRFWCTVPSSAESQPRTNLVNAYVAIQGVCILNLDRLDAPADVQITIQQESDIQIRESAPLNEFQILPTTIRDALGFIPPAQAHRRLKVRGVATLWRPGKELYVQDATGAIRVQSDQTNRVEIGDEVEVVGFRAIQENEAMLGSGDYRVVGKGKTVMAPLLPANEILNITNRSRLVQVDARLREDVPPSAAPELVLEVGRDVFTAGLEPMETGQLAPSWRANSKLRVTGICVLRLDGYQEPRAFRLLARTPADIMVLESPPWFTTQRIVALLLLLLVIVVASLVWIGALRRRVSDQTDLIRRRLESEAATQRRLALVWEASADGMRMTDGNGIVVQVNDAYCQMVQKTRVELEGCGYLGAFQTENPDSLVAEYQDRFQRRIVSPRQETEMILWNGQSKWFELTERFIEHTESSPLLLSQFRDVTRQKLEEAEKARLQERLAQAEKTESIGRLAGGVAHDFNNMLQVILGNTALALEETPRGSPLHQAMEEIHSSAQRSADLTRQLLTFARKQTVSPKILDLNETVASLLKMLQRLIGENIQLIWIPGNDLWPVKIDPAQVDQVLVNLCVNARDAIVETGRISIKTANSRFDEARVRAHPDCAPGDYVVLTVTDDGGGMDEIALANLFEPFFTTKQIGKGTGLGLATVFGIVKQNRGFIEAHSRPGKGATFTISLPRSEAPVAAPASRVQQAPLRGNETVLLVEDEEQILSLARRILTQYGYHVLATPSPNAALQMAREHSEPIQLLITDVIMPEMNGKELRQRLALLKPGIRCLYISGYTADVIAQHGVLEAGTHSLQKPFSVQTLTDKVREVMEGVT